MGLDIYFYKTKKNNNLTPEEAYNEYRQHHKKITTQYMQRMYEKATMSNNVIDIYNKAFDYLCKNVEYMIGVHINLLSYDKNTDKGVFLAQLKRLCDELKNHSISPKTAFYARKEWWIVETIWNISGNNDAYAYVDKSMLNKLILAAEEELGIEVSDDGVQYIKNVIKAFKRLDRTLKEDETIIAVFSY